MADGEHYLFGKNNKDTKLFKIPQGRKDCMDHLGVKRQEPAITVCPVVCESVQGNERKG